MFLTIKLIFMKTGYEKQRGILVAVFKHDSWKRSPRKIPRFSLKAEKAAAITQSYHEERWSE